MSKKNFIYNTLYQILVMAIPLLTTPYISRVLGAENIGLYSYSYAIAYYFAMFILLGLNNYGNRTIAFVRDNKEKMSRTFCEIYKMQMCVSILVVVAYILYGLFFANNLMTWIMLIYVISAVFDIGWLFFGLEQFKMVVLWNSIIKILSMGSIFIFVKSQDGVYIYAFVMAISSLLSQMLLWFYAVKKVKITRVTIKNALKHLKPNFVLFVPVIAISLYKIMDKIMLGAMSDLNQVGFYENSEKIVQVPILLVVSLGTVMMPKIANLASKGEHLKNKKYIKKSLYFAVFVSSLMCFGIMGMAKDFVPWYFGEGFLPCIDLLQILMPSCIFLAVANVIRTQYLIPYKHDKFYIVSVIVGAMINLIVNCILIPKLGAKGAAIGTLIAETSVCLVQLILIRNMIEIKMALFKSLYYVFIGIIVYLILLRLIRNKKES